MKKVFWENPYQSKLLTKIAAIYGNEILFEDTIAYSFAGGQESDKATVNSIPILSSRMEGYLIYYTLPAVPTTLHPTLKATEDTVKLRRAGHGFSVGDCVVMEIDWPRRNRLMRLHFAAELILEIVTQKFGFEKVGAHISEHKARIDFISPESISPKLPEILAAYNAIIDQDLPIEKGYLDVTTQRRFWRIANFAQVPCGGTHVDSTGQVGYVMLKREHPGKSIERIEIRLVNTEPTSESKN